MNKKKFLAFGVFHVTVNASDILKTCFICPFTGARNYSLKSLTMVIPRPQNVHNEPLLCLHLGALISFLSDIPFQLPFAANSVPRDLIHSCIFYRPIGPGDARSVMATTDFD